MKQTITEQMFIDAFHRCGRGEQFSNEGLIALFEHIEDCERDTGEQYELDPIALCCEFAEYDSAREAAADYGQDFGPEEEEEALEWLESETSVIEIPGGGVIIQNF